MNETLLHFHTAPLKPEQNKARGRTQELDLSWRRNRDAGFIFFSSETAMREKKREGSL